MYTNDEIDQEALRVLMRAAPGKDPNGRPKGLCAYQICESFDDVMAAHFIAVGGVGGAGGGGNGPAFTQIVQYSLKRLEDRGLVRHFYMDTRGLVFEIKGHLNVRPSYPVMAVYQYSGDRSAQEPIEALVPREPPKQQAVPNPNAAIKVGEPPKQQTVPNPKAAIKVGELPKVQIVPNPNAAIKVGD